MTFPAPRFPSTKQLRGKLSKIRSEVLGPGAMDGSPEPEPLSPAYDLTGACAEEEDLQGEEEGEVRDLSAWRVSVPRLEPRTDPATGKAAFVFIIQVQRIDKTSTRAQGEDLEWTVERQFQVSGMSHWHCIVTCHVLSCMMMSYYYHLVQEFYSLHAALVQYHGGFEDIKLPSRGKLFGGQRGLDVLQSKQEPFQEFLVKLLQVGE